MDALTETPVRNLRVVVQQPALPGYRIPVFRELSSRPGIELRVRYSTVDSLPNRAADGFDGARSRTWRLPGGLFWDAGQLQAVRGSTDVAILSWNIRYLSLPVAMFLARRRGVAVVLWGHGYSKRNNRAWQVLRWWAARFADAVVFYNHTEADRFARAQGGPERVFVAPNALDQRSIAAAREEWLASPDRLESFKAAHGLRGPMVLFVSRLEKANRVDILLDALGRVRARVPDATLVVIGDGPERVALEAEAQRLAIPGAVRFLGALYDENLLAPWFLAADAFCYPTNIGLSLLHAFGYGLPVIAGDDLRRHNPEIEALRDGENGLLFRDGSAASLALQIEGLLRDPDLRHRLRTECLRTVREDFTLARMVDGLESAIRFAAERRAARGRTGGHDDRLRRRR